MPTERLTHARAQPLWPWMPQTNPYPATKPFLPPQTSHNWEDDADYIVQNRGLQAASMEWLSTLLVAACVVAGGLCLFAWQLGFRKSGSAPPGPQGLPIIGHLHLLGADPHRALFRLSQLHGPLMWLRFGSLPVIIASSPQAARLVLQTHDQIFSGRPRPAAAVTLSYDCTDITFCPPNAYWRRMRQICVSDLVSPKRMEASRHAREEEAHKLVRAVMKEFSDAVAGRIGHAGAEERPVPGKVASEQDSKSKESTGAKDGAPSLQTVMVAMRTKLLQASNNIISRMVFGKTLPEMIPARTDHAPDPSLNLLDLLDELSHCLSIFNMGDFIPSIAWMDVQGVRRRSRRVARKLDIILQEILDLRRCARTDAAAPVSEDLLDSLLSLASREGLTDDNIKAFILDMFIGGTDTSGFTIEWAFSELLANQTELRMVQEEIDNVVGNDRMVQESDISCLPYLRAVVNETMRLHPVVPFLIPHVTTQSCKLMGFDVLPNTQVYVNAWAIGRDESTWDEPLSFKPKRFLNTNLSVEGKNYELLAFGAGRRGCPGSILGLINVQMQLASLLQAFHWCAPPHFDIEDKFGIFTTKAQPLVALVAPKVSNCCNLVVNKSSL